MPCFRATLRPLYLIVLVSGFVAPACSTPASEGASAGGSGNAPSSGSGGQASSGAAGISTAGGGRLVSSGGTLGTGGASGASAAGGNPASAAAGMPASAGAGASASGGVGGVAAAGGIAGTSAGGQTPGGAGSSAGVGGASSGGSSGIGAGGFAGSGSTHTGVWRIMPLGDSITQSTCYPQLLSQKLKDAGHTNFELLGSTTNNQSCNGAPNVKTEGHGGYILGCLTGDFTSNCSGKGTMAELATWLAATPAPDVALVHFGTNDVWNNIPTSTITTSYTKLMSSLRAANPSIIVFIAQILPMHPDNCMDGSSNCPNDGVKTLNAAIPAWATGASTPGSPVYVVDIYNSIGDPAAFVPNSINTGDGVHPNATGSSSIADAWMTAILAHGIAN